MTPGRDSGRGAAPPSGVAVRPLPGSGLLSWQVCFLAYVAGVWSLREPQAALASAAALWLGLVLVRESAVRRAAAFLGLMALCFAAGHWHAGFVLPQPPEALAAYAEGRDKVLVRGVVDEVADKAHGRLEILLRGVTVRATGDGAGLESATEPLPGLLAWDWDEPGHRPAPGQAVEAQLRVRPVHGFRNPGGADFEWQQRLRGVFHRAYTRGEVPDLAWGEAAPAPLWSAREALRASVLRHLPDDQGGAVLLGLLLGDRSRIDLRTTEELRAAGLAHTLALSGLNVVYVAVLGWALAWLVGLAWPAAYLRLPRPKLAVLLSAPLVAAYVWVGGGSPSLVRAALMFGFWGLFLLLDRGRALIDGLFFALAAIILPAPLAVFDVSLQMSALAVAGLCLVQPWLAGLARFPATLPGRGLRLAWETLTLAASSTLVLLPVTAWYFGMFPPNFLPNLPWLPVQGFLVQLPGMLGMALAALPGLDQAGGALLRASAWVQQAMLEALHGVARDGWLPVWALLRPRWPELLGAGMVLALVPPYWSRARQAPWALITAGLLLCAAPHAWMLAEDRRDEVRLEVLDVGQSQAVLLTGPGGVRALVDGGGSLSRTFDLGRGVVGPHLAWGHPPRLDAVLLSHPDADHAQGLAHILRHFEVGALYTNGRWPEGDLGQALGEAVAARGIPVRALVRGDTVDLGGGLTLEVGHPWPGFESRRSNESSLVLRALWRGEPLALLPGDVQRGGIEDMVDAGVDLRAPVLLLPHHGSKSSLSGMLYEAVAPALALASCGYQNVYGFPNAAVAEELARRGIPLAATSERGWLEARFSAPGAAPLLRSFVPRSGP